MRRCKDMFNNEANLVNERATLEIMELKANLKWMELVQGKYGEMYLVNGETVLKLTDTQRSYIENRGVRNGIL